MKLNYILIGLLVALMFSGTASAWYDTDWDSRIPISIDNTGNPSLEYYQFNVSLSGINATSIRVVNDSSATVVPHWCENVTGGLCYELWFNTSVGSNVNNDHFIYYGNPTAANTSNYSNTFAKKYNDSGLVLELHMDEGTGTQANDTSGEGNHGTMYNMISPDGWQGTDGGKWDNRDMTFVDGDHLGFDGANDYVGCPDDASLDFGTGDFTLSAWVYSNGFYNQGSSFNSIMSKGPLTGAPTGYYGFFIVSSDVVRFSVIDDGYRVLGNNIKDGWHHLSGRRSGNTISLYIDGVHQGTTAVLGSTTDTPDFYMGGDGATNRFFDGLIDEVRIYNRSLSQDEIYRQYIRSKHATNAPVTTVGAPYLNITIHSKTPPGDLLTNYTGTLVSRYIVESNTPLNYSSLAFLAGVNNTVTSDMHSHIKVPANTIAADGIYRAHFRNTSPALLWKDNTTLTNGNVWQWAGYDNNSVAITKESINNTHTWINVTGHTSIVFPSMYYIDVVKQVSAPMAPVHINKHQGIIMKVWDLEHLRGRSNDYWVNMFFDTALQATPDSNIDLWYCNSSFDPAVDDPTTCAHCVRMDTWTSTRWTDDCPIQFHPNSSYAKPLTVYAGQDPGAPPDTINYIYLTSETVTSKSYILNAMNYDPGICNITYAQTETMWLRDEIAGTNSPYAYTPNLYMTFVRDYTEFLYSFHIQNTDGVWGSNYSKSNIGVANVLPTHTKFNYFWWGNETDYNMTGQYVEDFWVNVSYGTDPDNGAALTHVFSLYTAGGTFVTTINDTLTGNGTDADIFCAVSAYTGRHKFQIISTDNEGTSTTSWSELFYLSSGTDEEIPLNLFIVLMILMFGSLFYIYHAETYVSKIVTSMITMWLAFMLSGMIISGTVVLNYAELSSVDAFVYGSYAIQIASLSHFFMFIGVVSTLFMLGFAVMLVADTYKGMQEKNKTENEWDGVDEQ